MSPKFLTEVRIQRWLNKIHVRGFSCRLHHVFFPSRTPRLWVFLHIVQASQAPAVEHHPQRRCLHSALPCGYGGKSARRRVFKLTSTIFIIIVIIGSLTFKTSFLVCCKAGKAPGTLSFTLKMGIASGSASLAAPKMFYEGIHWYNINQTHQRCETETNSWNECWKIYASFYSFCSCINYHVVITFYFFFQWSCCVLMWCRCSRRLSRPPDLVLLNRTTLCFPPRCVSFRQAQTRQSHSGTHQKRIKQARRDFFKEVVSAQCAFCGENFAFFGLNPLQR